MSPEGCSGAAKSTSPQARPKKVRDTKLNKIPHHADCAVLFAAVLIKRKKPANSQRYLAWAGANVRCGACHRRPKVRPWIPIYSPLSPPSRHSRTPNSTRWPMPHTRHRGSQGGLLAWIEGALEQPLQSAELDRPKLAGQRPSRASTRGDAEAARAYRLRRSQVTRRRVRAEAKTAGTAKWLPPAVPASSWAPRRCNATATVGTDDQIGVALPAAGDADGVFRPLGRREARVLQW